MPIYEYRRSRCKNVFELIHKMGEDWEAVCPKCMAPVKSWEKKAEKTEKETR